MFCNEAIMKVYEGQREYRDLPGANAFFDCYHDLAYHVTDGYRIVLETENYYISLGAGGVSLHEKKTSIDAFAAVGEWLEPFIHDDFTDEGFSPWVDYESTLFVGERLIDVIQTENGYRLKFDDFELKLIPHDLGKNDIPSLGIYAHSSYHHVYGCERLIKAKCNCGGTGELLLDFVSDYVVRCKECKKSTWAQQNAITAIDDWNDGNLNCILDQILIE